MGHAKRNANIPPKLCGSIQFQAISPEPNQEPIVTKTNKNPKPAPFDESLIVVKFEVNV
ncbi:hypothetical protein [Bernardetia litoralis]|uniref:hypothetical protein n=1 Tax=Bernardetia litoralis TaxID=999 RepID=UPI0012FD0D34|nr:hypothetical protein [Bernardetia litoralis]